MSDSDPIPLYDGPPTGPKIEHPDLNPTAATENNDGLATPIRGSRRNVRHELEGVKACLATHDASGRNEFADCPVVDISVSGIGLEFDRRLKSGLRCNISYRTRDHRTVHVGGTVRRCRQIEGGYFEIGIQFDRHLHKDEMQPARVLPGAAASPLQRGRQLKRLFSAPTTDPDIELPRPNVIRPSAAHEDTCIDFSDDARSE